MSRYIGLDLGTSAVKGVALGVDGEVTSTSVRSFPTVSPRSGWVEYESSIYLSSVYEVIADLAAADEDRVAGLGISGASGNTMLLDRHVKPLTRFISWLDTRTLGKSPGYFGGIDIADIHETTGWYWAGGMFPMGHVSWWRNEDQRLFAEADRIVMNNDYLTWELTGEWGMDTSSATPSYLQHQTHRKWHQPYLEAMEITDRMLSPILPVGTEIGSMRPRSAQETGLSPGTPVYVGSFDHPSAARASGIGSGGDLLLSCGTSWVGFFPIADRQKGIALGLLVDPFESPSGLWGSMFSLPGYGRAVDRVVNELFGGDFAAFDADAMRGSAAADGIMLGPEMDPVDDEASCIAALRSLDRASAARALMEHIVFLMKKRIDDLEKSGLYADRVAMVGGPSRRQIWPEIAAHVLGKPVILGYGIWAGAVGAAMSAMTGEISRKGDVGMKFSRKADVIEPSMSEHAMYAEAYHVFSTMKSGDR